ncbi:MAG: hypothetical protein IJ562_04695 [Prevotella sp.]|nr:hypothetical protein [Prevotella sp.]
MKMKRILLIPMLLFAAVLTTGCSDDDDENCYVIRVSWLENGMLNGYIISTPPNEKILKCEECVSCTNLEKLNLKNVKVSDHISVRIKNVEKVIPNWWDFIYYYYTCDMESCN